MFSSLCCQSLIDILSNKQQWYKEHRRIMYSGLFGAPSWADISLPLPLVQHMCLIKAHCILCADFFHMVLHYLNDTRQEWQRVFIILFKSYLREKSILRLILQWCRTYIFRNMPPKRIQMCIQLFFWTFFSPRKIFSGYFIARINISAMETAAGFIPPTK